MVTATHMPDEVPEASSPHRALFAGLMALLFWAPIPLGSNRPWSAALLVVLSWTLLGVWLAGYTRRPFLLPTILRSVRWPLALLCIWAMIPLLQLIPLPGEFVNWLNPMAYVHYATAYGDGAHNAFYLSVDRGATFLMWLKYSSYVVIFTLTLVFTNTERRLRTLLTVIILVGVMQALYGLSIYFAGEELGLWDPRHSEHTITGTYVNQNHFAGLMEIALCVTFGMMIARRVDRTSGFGTRSRVRSVVEFALADRSRFAFFALLICAALLMTASRGALAAVVLAMTITVAASAILRGRRTVEARMWLGGVGVALVAIAWLGVGSLVDKLEARGLQSNRGELRELSYKIIRDYPAVGSGAGTYRWVLPQYKDERFETGFYEHAHNDYLEVLGEQGILGFTLAAGAVLLLLARMLSGLKRRRRRLVRGALVASFAGSLSLLIHGLVDFNLQIPANGAYFFVILACGALACELRQEKTDRDDEIRPRFVRARTGP